MGWWITLGILVLLAVLPLGVSVRYDEDGALVRIIAGPIKITLFPRPKKVKKPKKEKKPKEKNPKQESSPKKSGNNKKKAASAPKKQEPVQTAKVSEPEQQSQPARNPESPKTEEPADPENKEKKKGGSLLDFLPLVKTVFDFLGDFKRKLRVNLLELKLTLAADDPCDLAVNYGRAWAALGNLLPRLEQFLVIQRRDIDVQCDFTARDTTVYARLDLTITLGRILAAVFKFAFHALVEFIKIMIKRKGGTKNEPESP